MCFCRLLEFSHGFVVLRSSPLQNSKGTRKDKVPVQFRAQAGPEGYFQLANKLVEGAALFANGAALFGFAAIALLAFSINQNSVGMSEMRARMDKSESEMRARIDKAEAERKEDKEEMKARMDKAEEKMKEDKVEMRVVASLTLLIAIIALKPDQFLSKLFPS